MTTKEAVASLMSNKQVNFLVGQVMKKTKGQANPLLAKKLIIKQILMEELGYKWENHQWISK